MARRAPARGVPAFFLSYWLPVLLYLTIIFFLSAQPSLTPPLQFTNSDKFYHVGEYFGLGILLVRAIRASAPSMRVLNAALVALCLGIVVGTSDEMFQSVVPGRQSDPFDLMADTAGVLLAQLVTLAMVKE
jgi:VanZ family protein